MLIVPDCTTRDPPQHVEQPSPLAYKWRIAIEQQQIMSYSQERRREERILSRPSATSAEYEGQSRSASIHNMIEQQCWEKRAGVSDNFDPERRGYTFSRDGRRADNHRNLRERSRERQGHEDSQNQRDRTGYRQEDRRSTVDRTSGGYSFEKRRRSSHYDDDNRGRRDSSYDDQRREQRPREQGDYQRSYPDRQSPSRDMYDRDHGHSQREKDRRESQYRRTSSDQHPLRGHDRDHHNPGDGYNDRRGQGNQHSQSAGHNGGGQNNFSQSSRPPSNDDNGWDTVPNRSDRRKNRRQSEQKEAPPPQTMFIPQNASNGKFQQFMLMLTGIPGSGKSTFAESLVNGKPWMYVRVNQDTLGNRWECENLTRSVLQDGKCPIIDRCNFDPAQRKHFLDIAKSFSIPVDCIVLQFDMDLCIRRCRARPNHETITAQNAVEVVGRMVRQFSPPLPNRINAETFRNIKTLSSSNSFNDLVMEYLNMMS
jgi:predicted kinase